MTLIIPDYVQITEIDGKFVLLESRKNYFYAVSKTGSELIAQLKDHGNMENAIKKISSDYKISSEIVEKDMTLFVQRLIEKGLVTEK